MKLVRFLAIVLAGIIAILALGSAIAVGDRTFRYMNNQKFSFTDAWTWAVQDYNDWLQKLQNDVFRKEEKEVILEFPMCNQNIQVVACTALD